MIIGYVYFVYFCLIYCVLVLLEVDVYPVSILRTDIYI